MGLIFVFTYLLPFVSALNTTNNTRTSLPTVSVPPTVSVLPTVSVVYTNMPIPTPSQLYTGTSLPSIYQQDTISATVSARNSKQLYSPTSLPSFSSSSSVSQAPLNMVPVQMPMNIQLAWTIGGIAIVLVILIMVSCTCRCILFFKRMGYLEKPFIVRRNPISSSSRDE